jgi:HK97 family phage prohead protease
MSERDETRDDAYRECRVDQVDGNRLSGYAIVFNSLSVDLGGFREQIDPKAVDRSLTTAADIRALVDHDSGKVIGRTRAGTLTLQKNSKGLRFSAELDPEISYARDILRAVSRGDVSGMSFGFRVMPGGQEWDEDADGTLLRTVTDMSISEVSVVAFPAYPDTSVAQRELRTFLQTARRDSVAMRQRQLRNLAAR